MKQLLLHLTVSLLLWAGSTQPAFTQDTGDRELSVNLQTFIQNGSDIVATNPFLIVERGIPSSGSRFYRIRRLAEEEG